MTNIRTIAVPVAACAGLLALAAPPALAQQQEIVVTGKMQIPEGHDPVTKVVNIEDLDLTSESGSDEMEKRVAAAIKQICFSHPKPARWQVKEAEACSEFAWEGARPQMLEAIAQASEE